MALSGFKDFVSGTVLSEGDIDSYLMQGVLVFANSAAADDALGITNNAGGLFPGRTIYLTQDNLLQCWNGTAFVNIATQTYVNNAVAAIREPLIRLYMDAGLSMM
jgi:hypothetical protein